uniref:Integrase catalytic domain-containing protein n=1 Tax=Tanacetum cinerariifolium TaxID=118510 RepID=A0A699IDS8_TANCI|nr:hypothetical protein [Tanacetum cinerariifolium]
MLRKTVNSKFGRVNSLSTSEPVSAATSVSAIDANDLEEMDLKWKMAMKGHFARECRSPKDTRRSGAAEPQRRNVSVETFTSNALVSQCDGLRDNSLVTLRQNLEKAEQERDYLNLKLEKFQTSSKNLTELLASQTHAKTGNGYHIVPPPYTKTFMPPKPDLVFNNALNAVETDHPAFPVKLSPTKPDQDLSHTYRPSAPIIEDWISDFKDKFKPKSPQNIPSFVQPTEQVKSPRHSVQHVETSIPTASSKTAIPKPRQANTVVTKSNSPPKRHINRSLSPKANNFPPKVSAVKALTVNAAKGNPQHALQDKRVNDSGCSRHVTGNMSYLSDFEELNGGYVAFGGNPKGGKISGKGKIRTRKLDFNDVYSVKELKFNLFSVSQMCDKKNSILFTDTECLVLSHEFKLPDENQVLLRVPRENIMYNANLKNIVSSGDLTCLFAKATIDESNLWHRRLGHINFKTMNKLVKGNLVRGLPKKVFKNDNTCVACKKGKQHRASCKTKPVSSVNQPLYRLHMNLFGPTFVKSPNKKIYCLVVTDDYSRLRKSTKSQGIKREFSVPRTPQRNGIAERKNRTLIEAARTMLADLFLPILFWAEAVNIACYVHNRVLVTKPRNKTPYELLHGRIPSIGFMRPFGCHVTILNTLDSLGKFDGNVVEGFLVGYSVSSKAFRVFNSRTRIVQETLHVNFLENKPNVAGNQSNPSAGIQEQFHAEKAGEESDQQHMFFTVWSSGSINPQNTDRDAAFDEKEPEFEERKPESEVNVSPSSSAQSKKHDDKTKRETKGKSPVESLTRYRNLSTEFEDLSDNNINEVNAAGTLDPAVGQLSPNSTNTFSAAGPSNVAASLTYGKSSCIDTSQLLDDPDMPELEDITYSDDVGAEADFNNLETSITVSPIPTTRVHKDHPVTIRALFLTTMPLSSFLFLKTHLVPIALFPCGLTVIVVSKLLKSASTPTSSSSSEKVTSSNSGILGSSGS